MISVLSLFDGLSGAKVALDNLGIHCNYYASEIDKYAIKISQKNYPEIVRLGDVREVSQHNLPEKIDLLIGGSPCQDLSCANNKQKGLNGERSGLFWEYARLLNEVKPRYFLLENVASMSEINRDLISVIIGCEPIIINSALLTAQSRKRLYWTNIPNIKQPEDKNIHLKDILVDGIPLREKSLCITANYHKRNFTNFKKSQGEMVRKSYCLPATYYKENTKSLLARKKRGLVVRLGDIGSNAQAHRVYSLEGKAISLIANGGGQGGKTGLYLDKDQVRKLHPIECERLQGLPDNYTEGVSNTQRYKMIGNGFTVPVIEHILSYAKI